MTMCIVCNQRTAQVAGKYCSYPCCAVDVGGVQAVKSRHAIVDAQKTAREAKLATSLVTVGGVLGAALDELRDLAADDDGVDR